MKIGKLAFFLIIALVFWRLIAPFPHVANDLHFLYPAGLEANFSLPVTFNDFEVGNGLGERTIFSMWFWPVRTTFAILGKLGISFTYLMMILAFIPMLALAALGIYRLLGEYKIGRWGKTAGTLFYLLNTYFLLLVDGGQINLAITYALLPWAFLYTKRAISVLSIKSVLKALLPLWGISIFDPRAILILAILILLKFLIDIFYKNMEAKMLLNYLLLGVFLLVSMLALHFYWVLPAWFARGEILPVTHERVSQVSFLSFANIGHSLILEAPHWYKNIFGKVAPIEAKFFLIPILVFLAPILRKKDKVVGFWLIVAVVAVFLSKGSIPPLGQIYSWLFSNVPGFSFFRDPTKFFFLTALSYSVLIGVTINQLDKRFGRVVPLLLMFYLLLLAAPVYMGKMTGVFSKPINQKEYLTLADKLSDDNDFGRILWIPTKAPLGYSSPIHPSLEASRLTNLRPFASAIAGTYETFNYLRAPYVQYLLDIAGIKYIVYPYPDTRREVLKQDNIDYYHWFLGKIADSSWGHIAGDLGGKDSPVPVVEVNKHQDRFFLSPNIWWVIGSDRIYGDLAELPDFDLSKNALVFAEEHPGLSQRLKEFPNARLLIYGKNDTDLAANFLDGSSFIFPAKNLDFSPTASSGWWKRETADLISWRGFLQEKYGIDNQDFDYGGGWAVGEGNVELQILNDKLKKGNILLARVMESTKGGKIEFYQGSYLVGVVLTKPESVQDDANVRWFEVGSLKSEAPVEIKTYGDINVVNALASIPVSEWSRINELTRQYKKEEKPLFKSAGEPAVNYRRINSTHYKVEVKGIIDSAVLAFSETYDPLWQMNGKKSFPLYSLINGFHIDKDGTYDIYFTPQRYVVPGLIVSAIAFFSLVGFLR